MSGTGHLAARASTVNGHVHHLNFSAFEFNCSNHDHLRLPTHVHRSSSLIGRDQFAQCHGVDTGTQPLAEQGYVCLQPPRSSGGYMVDFSIFCVVLFNVSQRGE